MKIAVLDTGVNLEYDDFKQVHIESKNFLEDGTCDNDENGHGTSTIGEIIKGDPAADIVSLKVLDHRKRGRLKDVIEALEYCGSRDDIQMVHMSFACIIEDFAVQCYMNEMIQELTDRGIMVVCSCLNSNEVIRNGIECPVACDKVIAVRKEYSPVEYFEFIRESKKYVLHGPDSLMPQKDGKYKFYHGNSSAAARVTGLISSGILHPEKIVLQKTGNVAFYDSSCESQPLFGKVNIYLDEQNIDFKKGISTEDCITILKKLQEETKEGYIDYKDYTYDDFCCLDRILNRYFNGNYSEPPYSKMKFG